MSTPILRIATQCSADQPREESQERIAADTLRGMCVGRIDPNTLLVSKRLRNGDEIPLFLYRLKGDNSFDHEAIHKEVAARFLNLWGWAAEKLGVTYDALLRTAMACLNEEEETHGMAMYLWCHTDAIKQLEGTPNGR